MLRALVIDIAVFVCWSVLHSLAASLTVKRWARRVMGRWFLLYRFLYVSLSALGLLAIWLWLPRPGGVLYIIPPPWSTILYLVQAGAIALFLIALRQFDNMEFLGVRQLGRLGADEEHEERLMLNAKGLYGTVRHPLYLTAVVAMAANPAMTVWWLLLTLWIAVYFWIGSHFEERRMVAMLGDAYRRYQEDVPKFVPSLRRTRGGKV